jgi:geranylgeranyl reductase family protein
MKYDVVVVGLGPGGASATYSSAKSGLKVLGIEKRREIGVPIQCGEFLPANNTYSEILPDAKHLELLTTFPDYIVRNRTRMVSMFSPKGVEYIDYFDGVVIDRSLYDKWIVSKAVEEGADINIGCTVFDLIYEGDGYRVLVRGSGGSFEVMAKTIVIAGGAGNRLIERVGLEPEKDENNLGHVIQYMMVGVDTDDEKIEMYTGKKYCPGAYAWIIPRGDGFANVGLGIRRNYVSKGDRDLSLRDFLHRFIYKHPVASKKLSRSKPVSLVGGLVPVGPPRRSVGRDALLVGDSANQVIASVGAGVPTSVIAGTIAGEVLAGYLVDDLDLMEYERRWRMEIGEALENGYKIREMIDIMCRNDFIMEQALKLFAKEHLSDLIRQRLPTSVKFVNWVRRLKV